jgi:hypothetical protein
VVVGLEGGVEPEHVLVHQRAVDLNLCQHLRALGRRAARLWQTFPSYSLVRRHLHGHSGSDSPPLSVGSGGQTALTTQRRQDCTLVALHSHFAIAPSREREVVQPQRAALGLYIRLALGRSSLYI